MMAHCIHGVALHPSNSSIHTGSEWGSMLVMPVSPFLVPTQQTDGLSEVTIDAGEDELFLESNCYVKVDTSA